MTVDGVAGAGTSSRSPVASPGTSCCPKAGPSWPPTAWRARRSRCGEAATCGRPKAAVRREPGDDPRRSRHPRCRRGPVRGGRLFGSIGPPTWSRPSVSTRGVEIEPQARAVTEHIKEVGSFDITVELFTGVATVVTLEVTAASWSAEGRGIPAGCHIPVRPWWGADQRSRSPQTVTGCPQPHRGCGGSNPQLVALVPHSSLRAQLGTVIQAFEDTRPRPLRAAPAPRAVSRSPRTTSKRRSPYSAAICCCPTMRLGSPSSGARPGTSTSRRTGHIFRRHPGLIERGEPIDAVTVTDELPTFRSSRGRGRPVSVHFTAGQHPPSIANAAALRRHCGRACAPAPSHRRGRRRSPTSVTRYPRMSKLPWTEAEQMMFNVRRAADGGHHVPPARVAPQGARPH